VRRCCSLLISCSVIMLLSLLGGLFFGGVCVCVCVFLCINFSFCKAYFIVLQNDSLPLFRNTKIVAEYVYKV